MNIVKKNLPAQINKALPTRKTASGYREGLDGGPAERAQCSGGHGPGSTRPAEAIPGPPPSPFENRLERHTVTNREIGEDLPVQPDAALVHGVDEYGVGYSVHAGRGADAGDPETPEISFAFLAASVGIDEGVVDSLRRVRYSLDRPPRKPFASLRTLFFRFREATLVDTLAIARFLPTKSYP